jgi:hypothetical protein
MAPELTVVTGVMVDRTGVRARTRSALRVELRIQRSRVWQRLVIVGAICALGVLVQSVTRQTVFP